MKGSKKKYVEKYPQPTLQKYMPKQQMQENNAQQLKKKVKYIPKKQQIAQQKEEGRKTTVVNVKVKFLRENGYNNLVEWLQNPKHVYIGRNMSFYVPGAVGSKWANPFKVDKVGREACVQLYKKHILEDKDLVDDLKSLKGKVLGCWCKPEACHGDILAKLADQIQK